MTLSDRQALAFVIFAVLIIFLLSEISFSLQNVKIVLAIKSHPDNVIEGEAREVPDRPASN
jgi:uncharacterized protein YoxC